MHYISNLNLAFLSVEHIMRNVNNGWLLRYIHSNGASLFFIVVYIHIFRGIFFGSFQYPRYFLWIIGIIIFLLMIITAFFGKFIAVDDYLINNLFLNLITTAISKFKAIKISDLKIFKKESGVYCIENDINNKKYIGSSTVCKYTRIYRHFTGRGNKKLYEDFKKSNYNFKNFNIYNINKFKIPKDILKSEGDLIKENNPEYIIF